MFSPFIDRVWHQTLKNPAHYVEFSTHHAGVVFGHQRDKGYGRIPWVRDYERRFRTTLPAVWFADQHGNVDDEAWATYRATGDVVASWDCSPTKD